MAGTYSFPDLFTRRCPWSSPPTRIRRQACDWAQPRFTSCVTTIHATTHHTYCREKNAFNKPCCHFCLCTNAFNLCCSSIPCLYMFIFSSLLCSCGGSTDTRLLYWAPSRQRLFLEWLPSRSAYGKDGANPDFRLPAREVTYKHGEARL